MPICRSDVIRGYEVLLGRQPESDHVIDVTCDQFDDVWTLAECLVNSTEGRSRYPRFSPHTIYTGYVESELKLLEKYWRESSPSPGFVTDFVGSKTDVTFNAHLSQLGGHVEALPVPGSFHAETIEWIGLLKAVDSAKQTFTIGELGAGWGPWLVSGAMAARHVGLDVSLMVGVEADAGHYAFMRRHLANNGFDPDKQVLLEGIAGPTDEDAFFPIVDSLNDWGAAAVFSSQASGPLVDYRDRPFAFRQLRSYSLATILGERVFDLVHIDIQGAEKSVIPAGISTLNKQVRWLVIGTHSRSIEGQLFDILSANDWVLTNEKPCRFLTGQAEALTEKHTTVDGSQVWRNARF